MSGSRGQKRFLAFAAARLRRLGAQTRNLFRAEIDERADARAADLAEASELADAAADLRGGVAKVAQMRAYLTGAGGAAGPGLGREAQAVLGRLWDGVPGDEPRAIRAVVEADLGQPPEALFASWDDHPLAAASLGQVHAATGHDGRALAVKVQYPGVAAALRDDLGSRRMLEQLVGADLGTATPEASLEALRARLLAELDYVTEAQNQQRFRGAFLGDAAITIPAVVKDRSAARVLTMERLTGRSLPKVMATGSQAERDAVARTIFRFAWSGPLRHGLVNIDPNPGNYLVPDAALLPSGEARVGFIDFGSVAEIAGEVRAADRALWMAMIRRDGEALRHAAYRSGLCPRPAVFDTSTYRAWEALLGGPFLDRGVTRLTTAYVRDLSEQTFRLAQTGQMALPPDVLLLWRQRLGVLSVLCGLRPALPFRALLAAVLDDGEHPVPLLSRHP